MKFPLRDSPGGKKNRNAVFGTVVVIAALFILSNIIFPDILPGRLNSLGKPMWQFREFISDNLAEFRDFLVSKNSLVAENKSLQNKLEVAGQELVKLNLLKKENEELKDILGREENGEKILARVLSKESQSLYGTFIIDVAKRKSDRPKKGQEVFSPGGILIGLVDEVYENTARVKLLSAPGNKYNVEVGSGAIPAEAVGLGGGNFEIVLPRGVSIETGDEIISPALSIKLLGVVEHIDSKPQKSMQKILFKSPVNINQLKWVLIEKPIPSEIQLN